MKTRRWAGISLVLLVALVACLRLARPFTGSPRATTRAEASSQTGRIPTPLSEPPGRNLGPKPTLLREPKLRPTATHLWHQPVPEKVFAQFHLWIDTYLAAPDAETRDRLEVEGLRLAKHRRDDLAAIVRANPKRALELTLPLAIRRQLPQSIQDLLEVRVDAKGDFGVLAALAEPGKESQVEPLYRTVTIDDRNYRAFVYGRREAEPTRFNIPLHGIAIDDALALDENPIRILEAEEIEELDKEEDPSCAISATPAAGFGSEEALDLGGATAFVCSTAHAELLNDQYITAESGGDSTTEESGILRNSAATEGIKKLIAIRVDFSDLPGAPFSDRTGTNMISNLNAFYSAMSYGRTGFKLVGDGSIITPTLRLPKTAAEYGASDASVLRSDARAAARAAGIEPRNYDYDLTCFGAVPGFGWAGLGFVGAPGSWIRASFDEAGGVPAHELGHNFGLNHANYWDTGDQSTIGPGSNVEYGDGFDTMGNAGAGKRHFNARYKNLLNWLPNTGVLVYSTNGLYRIAAHDEPDATGHRALRILKNSATNYWVEFRQRYTNNAWLMNGVGLRWARSGTDNRQSLLLDTSPGSADGKNDSAITLGRTFSDTVSGIHITPLRKLGTKPESVEIAVYKGSFTNNRPPTVRLSASAATVAVNGTVTFTAVASDPDGPGETLAYDWDFNDSSIGENQPVVSKKWAAAGEYVVRCTVSDLKGGKSSDSLVIRAGAPTTVRLAGRVLRDGKPVPGVRVFTSNTKSTWTDDEGTYVLAGLAKGSYTVRAAADGLLFTRKGFTNPINLQANRADIDFEASLPGDLANNVLVPSGALWRYLDNGSNQGTAWRTRSFSDSHWNQGAAQLGYGDDDVLTKLNFGTDENAKFITYYFRHTFTLDDPNGFLSLVLGVVRDDGAVVYLNNKEVFRSNMPTGTITHTTRASSSVGGSDESTFFESDIDPSLLVAGENLLAVEIHQSAPDSSDLSFNLQLIGLKAVAAKAPELTFHLLESALEVGWVGSDTSVLQTSNSPENNASWTAVDTALIETVDGAKVARIPFARSQQFFRLLVK